MELTCLMVTETTVFDVEVEVILVLQFLKDITIGFFVKVFPAIENFETKALIL